MFGVVLWSDSQENKAVIWCEDHGDLAFYRKSERDDRAVALDTGDWVQFDLTTDRDMRFAHNPRLLAEGVYPGIADALGSRAKATPASARRCASDRSSADIIPFRSKRMSKDMTVSAAKPCLA